MKLDKLKEEALNNILSRMSPADVAEYMKTYYTDILVGMIHTLCCRGKHGESCHFYQEEEMTESEERPSHLKWKAITQVMIEESGIDLSTEIHLILSAMPVLINWTSYPPQVTDFLTTLLNRARKGGRDEESSADLVLLADVVTPKPEQRRGLCYTTTGDKPKRPDNDSG